MRHAHGCKIRSGCSSSIPSSNHDDVEITRCPFPTSSWISGHWARSGWMRMVRGFWDLAKPRLPVRVTGRDQGVEHIAFGPHKTKQLVLGVGVAQLHLTPTVWVLVQGVQDEDVAVPDLGEVPVGGFQGLLTSHGVPWGGLV